MKNSIDTIGNRTRDLLACSAVRWNICFSKFDTEILSLCNGT